MNNLLSNLAGRISYALNEARTSEWDKSETIKAELETPSCWVEAVYTNGSAEVFIDHKNDPDKCSDNVIDYLEGALKGCVEYEYSNPWHLESFD